jgi:alpha-amylase
LTLGCTRGTAVPEDAKSGGATATSGAGSSGAASAGGAGSSAGSAGSTSGGSLTTGGSSNLPRLENDTTTGAFVHLFEWRWADVAQECEAFLGPHGFTAVQVSPPSEHALLPGFSFPWWQRYQTVGYALESRSGTRAEFIDMVSRCRAAGVGIYVDAILNHTTAQSAGTGSAGTKFSKYHYPGLYEQADFHAPVCQIQGADYTTSAEHVQRCELVSLADLDTSSPTVRGKLAAYLSELLALGVRGFRLDAAKHMAPADLAGILALVTPSAGEQPYYFLEVIDYGGEAVHASDYLDVAGALEVDITEFKYERLVDAVMGRAGATLASLETMTEASWGLLPNARAVVFTNNHDTQRGDALFYQDGATHDLGNALMLAWPYGYPSLMSSYGFDRSTGVGRDIGPPSDGAGSTRPVYENGAQTPTCAAPPYGAARQGWICEHRSPYVASMLGFRKAAADAPLANFWSNGKNQIAFSRGNRAFLVVNHEPAALNQTLATGLPEGQYCDVIAGGYLAPASCAAASVIRVNSAGRATFSVPAETAVALHVNAKL